MDAIKAVDKAIEWGNCLVRETRQDVAMYELGFENPKNKESFRLFKEITEVTTALKELRAKLVSE